MTRVTGGPRRKAAATAALLLLAGGLMGVLFDRLVLLPNHAAAMPLTAQAMAARLGLEPAEQARVQAVLDSLHTEVTAAAEHGADSLRAVARAAHVRLEAALPPDGRSEFRAWLHDHHRQMTERMHGTGLHDARTGAEHGH